MGAAIANQSGIAFDQERWTKLKENWRKWWAGELERPIVAIWASGYESRIQSPKTAYQGFTSHYSPDLSVSDILDSWQCVLAGQRFLGDAFPNLRPNFGPGVMAAFLGAELRNTPDTTWFHPKTIQEAKDLNFTYDPGNFWFNRVRDIMRAAARRWQGQALIGMTDIGGNLDVISSFRPSDLLLLDLYDCPEEIKRLTWQEHELWWRYYEELNLEIKPFSPGYTAWAAMFSEEPYYMLQCDFCYMISPDMFDEFVKPELAASCRRLKNSFYHLDGIGELPHLDSLLAIPELKGVQWIPGVGQPGMEHWPEVYRKIHKAGKLIQVYGFEALDAVADQLGSAKGICMTHCIQAEDEDKARRTLEKYGIE